MPDAASGSAGAPPPPYALLLQRGAVHVLLHPEAGGAEALRAFVHAKLVADMACVNHDAHAEEEEEEAGGSGRAAREAPDPGDEQAWRAAGIFMRMVRAVLFQSDSPSPGALPFPLAGCCSLRDSLSYRGQAHIQPSDLHEISQPCSFLKRGSFFLPCCVLHPSPAEI